MPAITLSQNMRTMRNDAQEYARDMISRNECDMNDLALKARYMAEYLRGSLAWVGDVDSFNPLYSTNQFPTCDEYVAYVSKLLVAATGTAWRLFSAQQQETVINAWRNDLTDVFQRAYADCQEDDNDYDDPLPIPHISDNTTLCISCDDPQ